MRLPSLPLGFAIWPKLLQVTWPHFEIYRELESSSSNSLVVVTSRALVCNRGYLKSALDESVAFLQPDLVQRKTHWELGLQVFACGISDKTNLLQFSLPMLGGRTRGMGALDFCNSLARSSSRHRGITCRSTVQGRSAYADHM